jgi:hypothetical protein
VLGAIMKEVYTNIKLNIMYKIIIGVLLSLNVSLVNAQTVSEIAKNTLKETVSIYMLDNSMQVKSMGSGFIISNGLIVTNFHVIEGAYKGYIKTNDSDKKIDIDGFVALDRANDIALLQVSKVNLTGIRVSERRPLIGDKIFVAGNPQGLTGTFSDGIVSSVRTIEEKNLIQITAPISPGSSGGPVVNDNGELIGVAVGAYTNGQNLNFAIPVDIVQNLLLLPKNLTKISTLYTSTTKSLNQSSVNVQGIELRNIIWSDDEYAHDSNYEQLIEFSIKNNTENYVGKVHLIMLVYDKTRTMVDFFEAIFEKDLHYDDIIIPPNMAKTYNATKSIETKYGKYDGPPFRKRKGYYYELRILDYEVTK